MPNNKVSNITWFDGNTYDIYDENASPKVSTSSTDADYDVLFNVSGTPSYSNGNTVKINPSSGNLKASGFYVSDNGDLAEDIEVPDRLATIVGYCYAFDGSNYYLTTKHGDKNFIGIHSDTAGYVLNAKDSAHLRIALAGFILAHVDQEYKPMTPLVCDRDGYLTKANVIDRMLGRVIGYFWKPERSATWHNVKVYGRHWIKIR